jgi:hypothetical protein
VEIEADTRPHLDDPTDWLQAQLDWLDDQLSRQAQNRDRHRADVRLYEAVHATMPMRYHTAQVQQCTTRIDDLLDLRLRVVQRAMQEGAAQ